MKYLVTGGAGFIGSNIVRQLLENGETVRVLDNFSTGKRENLAKIESHVEIIEGDIRDFETVCKAVKNMDYVLHLAALASVPRSIEDPRTTNAINISGTLNVLEASRLANVIKVVSSSSSAVYGESIELPQKESMAPAPLSPYAVTKLAGEFYSKVYWELYGLPTVSLRYFNVFGPRQNPAGDYAAVIPKFINALLNNEPPVVFGDGDQTRDFIYIDDVFQANILAATDERIVGTVYNAASGLETTLNQLLDILNDLMDTDLEPEYTPPRTGDILHSYADISKFQAFGFQPKVGFRQGLEKTIQYFKTVDSSLRPVTKVNR